MTPLKFDYRGVDRSGRAQSGAIDAATRNDAFRALVAQGLTPTHLVPSQGVRRSVLSKSGRLSARKLADFTHAIGVLVDAKVPFAEGLRSIAEQESDSEIKHFALDVARRVESGESIAAAMDAHRAKIGQVYVETIRAAERTGNLPKLLAHLSEMLESSQETMRILRSALTYPACVVAALGAAMMFLVGAILPKFAAMFAQRHAQLPEMTRWLLAFGQSVNHYWYAYLGAAVLLALAFRAALRDQGWRERFDALLHKVPIVRSMLVGVALSRFCRVCGLALSAGISLVESLELAGSACGRPLLARSASALAKRVNAGQSLKQSVQDAEYFTPFARRMLSAGEQAGELPRMCEVVAKHYERESGHLAKSVGTLIEPVLIIGVAGLVLVMALSVLLPAWDMTRLVGG